MTDLTDAQIKRRQYREADRIAQQRRRDENKKRIRDYKEGRGCADCGTTNPIILQFHHRNGKGEGSTLNRASNLPWPRVEAELAECDVLCANCHIMRHYNEQSGYFANTEK